MNIWKALPLRSPREREKVIEEFEVRGASDLGQLNSATYSTV
jgi:hypothetical protein